ITDADAAWLDNDANQVDEDAVIDKLENTSDYERGLSHLDSKEKGLVVKLKELAGDIGEKLGTSAKRKRPQERKEFVRTGKKAATTTAAVFTKKEYTTLAQRIEILDWHHNQAKPSQSKTAKHFAPFIPTYASSNRMGYLTHWILPVSSSTAAWEARGNTKRVKQVEQPEVDDMLELWIAKAMRDRVHLTGEIIREKGRCFADLAGVPEDERLALNDGWLASLKKQCGLKELKCHGEADSANPVDITADRKHIQELIFHEGYALYVIFNMDETGLFWVSVVFSSLNAGSDSLAGCLRTAGLWTDRCPVSRASRNASCTPSQQMRTDPRNYPRSSLVKPNVPVHSTKNTDPNWAFCIATTPLHG
ncbi:hypothetical protein B0H17DRAFT_943909, partial [Mycena rosella]